MRLLVKEFPLVFSPTLAKCLGLKEAIFLQQLHYWIVKKQQKNPEDPKSIWVYNTASQWCQQLPFLKKKSFWRMISTLKQKNLLLVSNQNRFKFDKTNWYSLHYQNLHSFVTLPSHSPCPSPLTPFDPLHSPLNTPPIPETSHKPTHKSISLKETTSLKNLQSPLPAACKKKNLPSNLPVFQAKSLSFKRVSQNNVFLSKSQVVFLLKKYDKPYLKKFITKLSLYKLSSGKEYACDFAAILNWVAGAVLKEEKEAGEKKLFPRSSFNLKKHRNQIALKHYIEKNCLT